MTDESAGGSTPPASRTTLFESSSRRTVDDMSGDESMDRDRVAAVLADLLVARTPLGGVKFAFGLRAQGHLPTIDRMLDEGASWPDIGRAIGWDGEAAREWYGRELDCALCDGDGEVCNPGNADPAVAVTDWLPPAGCPRCKGTGREPNPGADS